MRKIILRLKSLQTNVLLLAAGLRKHFPNKMGSTEERYGASSPGKSDEALKEGNTYLAIPTNKLSNCLSCHANGDWPPSREKVEAIMEVEVTRQYIVNKQIKKD